MSEQYAKVVLYDLNCDGPEHDRIAFAKKDFADAGSSEYRTDSYETVAASRDSARRSGWLIRKDGSCLCPMCREALRGSP